MLQLNSIQTATLDGNKQILLPIECLKTAKYLLTWLLTINVSTFKRI